MDQDELEDEIFTKTIGMHLTMLSDYIRYHSFDYNSIVTLSYRREFFLYSVAVIFAIFAWLIHSGVLSKHFENFDFMTRGLSSLDNQVWQETEKSGGASGKFI